VTATVQLFAGAREAARHDFVQLTLTPEQTVADLRRALLEQVPGLARYGNRLWIAVNGQYAADSDRIAAGSEIACFPPVSGG
jgi:molybdopterin converting factor small subunit